MLRRVVRYTGRVQGVGFRARSERLAQGFAVAGSVRNLDDGRVELVAEGEPDAVAGLLDAVRRELGHLIRGAVEDNQPADPPLDPGFRILS